MIYHKSLSQYLEETSADNPLADKSDAEILSSLQSGLSNLVDKAVDDLKQQLLRRTPAAGGLMDTVKRWWSNFWYGKSGTKNPYYYHNVLGSSLGAPSNVETKKEHLEISLEHYTFLKKQTAILEANIVSASRPENTRLFAIINNWTKDFKNDLNRYLTSFMASGPRATTPSPILPSRVIPMEIDGGATGEEADKTLPLPCENPRMARMSTAQKIKDILKKLEDHGGEAATFVRKIKGRINKKDPTELLEKLCKTLAEVEDDTVGSDPDWLSSHLAEINYIRNKTTENLEFSNNDTLYERTLICLEKLRS